MGIEPTGPAVHGTQPALKTGQHTSTDPLPLELDATSGPARARPRNRLVILPRIAVPYLPGNTLHSSSCGTSQRTLWTPSAIAGVVSGSRLVLPRT